MRLHLPDEKLTSAEEALQLLKEGNERFVKGELSAKDTYEADRQTLSSGQVPYAIVLCCADSRVAPELYFDQRLGDIFVIRNAGNVVDDIVLGSIRQPISCCIRSYKLWCLYSSCSRWRCSKKYWRNHEEDCSICYRRCNS